MEISISKKKQKLIKLFKRRLKASRKYLQKIEDKLTEALSWEKKYHEAELLQSNLYLIKRGQKEIELADWNQEGKAICLTLDPKLKPHEEIALRFKKSKKLKLAQKPLKAQLEKAEIELSKNEEVLKTLETVESEEQFLDLEKKNIFPTLQTKLPKNVSEKPSKPYLEFFSISNIPIWVGKSAKSNDLLTFQQAHGNDLWLHAANYAGSHVVIHCQKEVDDETIKDALQLALHYSKAKNGGEAEICMTKRKFVTKFGKIPGKVQVANQKLFFVKTEQKRLQRLKDHSSSSLKR